MKNSKKKEDAGKLPAVVYGLDGIMSLFNVSKTTAWRYRNGIIKDACTQRGHVIIVDTAKALSLFGVAEPQNVVVGKSK